MAFAEEDSDDLKEYLEDFDQADLLGKSNDEDDPYGDIFSEYKDDEYYPEKDVPEE